MADSMHVKLADLLAPSPRGDRALQALAFAADEQRSVFLVLYVEGGTPGLRNRTVSLLRSIFETLSLDIVRIAPPRALEEALTHLNNALLQDRAESHPPYPTLHAVLGVRDHHQLFFSGCGFVTALYLHKTAERRFSIYELTEQFTPPKGTQDVRPFSNILDGELQPGDVFYVGAPLSPLAIKTDALHDILVTLPPAGALSRLRQYAPPQDGYAGIALTVQEERSFFAAMRPKAGAAVHSLQELQRLNDQTSDILGDLPTAPTPSHTAVTPLPAPGRRDIGAYMLRAATLLGRAWTTVIQRAPRATPNIRGRFPLHTRFVALGGFGAVAILVIAILLGRASAKQEAARSAFADQLASITDRISSAEASLLYSNVSEAQRALDEANALLSAVLPTTNTQRSAVDELRERYAAIAAQARGEQRVTLEPLGTNTNALASFGLLGSGPGTVLSDGRAQRFDTIARTFQDAATASASAATALPGTLQADGANALFLGTNNRLYRVDTNTASTVEVAAGYDTLGAIADIQLYNGTLYTLVPTAEQLLRSRASITGFEPGTPWIVSKNDRPLTDARALAIDGDIYIATSNTLRKFRQGRELPWSVANLTLQNPLDLWTSPESRYLYVLDPGAKKIVVIAKATDSIVAQYLNDALSAAVGFVVDETNKRITVATRDALSTFTPEHLLQ